MFVDPFLGGVPDIGLHYNSLHEVSDDDEAMVLFRKDGPIRDIMLRLLLWSLRPEDTACIEMKTVEQNMRLKN